MSEKYTVHGRLGVRIAPTVTGNYVEIELPPYMNGGLHVLLNSEQVRKLRDDLTSIIDAIEVMRLKPR